MGVIESNVQVSMYLPSLADVAEHPFPPGYSSRLYRRDPAKPNSGADAKAYHHIWEQADRRLWNDPELTLPDGWFVNGFGDNEDEHEDRITFVVKGESKLVGVTTAWYHTDPKGTMALVHYVAMLPECTGQGLSTPLMSAVLKRHRQLGHTECRLGTSTGRLAAINLYVKFGFLPLLNPEDPAKAAVEYRAWRELQPLLRETFASPFGPTPLWRPPAVAARL